MADQRFWLREWYLVRTGLDLVFADFGLAWVPWLALEVRSCPQGLNFRFRPYSKPGNVFSFTHFASYVPDGTKVGVVIGKALAAENRSDNETDMLAEWRLSHCRLQYRGFPAAWIDCTMQRWLAKRREGGGKVQRRESFHSVLSQDLLHETFVVTDHIDSFRPQAIRRRISDMMGVDCKIAVRFHPAVGDVLRGKAKAADPLASLRRVRHSEVPADVAEIWANVGEGER